MKRSLFGLGLLLLTASAANAQTQAVPPLMNFQGRLAKPDGTPLPDGTHTVTFTLYPAAAGGAALWTETDTVTVHNGAFAATLGKITALTDAIFAANDWLEIKVDNAAALTPRQQLVSVASAFKADTALTVPDGSITLTKLAPGVLNFNNIGGTVNSSQFGTNTIPTNALFGNPFAALGGFSVGPVLMSSIGTGATPTSVAVSGNVACVTPQGYFALQVFNVSNPAAPALSGTVSLGFQPFSVVIAGNYAYVAGGFNIPGQPFGSPNLLTNLAIVDISNPAAPTLTSSILLLETYNPSGTPDDTVVVAGNYAYVADIADNLLFVVNVSAPANPSFSSIIGTGTAPRSVAVSGSYAYVANQNDSTLQAFNVSNPASPTLAATVNTQSTPVGVTIAGNTAYVLANGTNTLQAFSLSNPAAPVAVGSAGTAGSPNAVTVSGGNAYVVNGTGNSLQVFNLANPSAPVLTQTIPADNNAFGVAVAGSLAYVTGYYDNVLQIFNLNGAMTTTLQVSGSLTTSSISSPTNSVYVHGNSFMDSLNLYGGLTVDYNATNYGSISGAAIRFGAGSGEGIVSNRTGNANRYGLDLYTDNAPRVSVTNGGNVGVNTQNPQQALSVAGGFVIDQNDTFNGVYTRPGIAALTFGNNSGEGIGSNRNQSNANFGGLEFYTGLNSRMSIANNGYVGIGTRNPQYTLDVNGTGNFTASGTNGVGGASSNAYGNGVYGFCGSSNGYGGYFYGGEYGVYASGGQYGIVAYGSSGTAGVFDGAITVNGGTTTHFVNIVGGSDVAEPYNVAAAGEVNALPGMLVSIDANQVGQMRVSSRAYDANVAGIISGANGIQPGITLRQTGTVADGALPVASIGRVWCWCDADANGPIEAGNMLTSSDTPGHAMKATDRERRDGAIIGKAMSSLKSGKGLVLVLVSLK